MTIFFVSQDNKASLKPATETKNSKMYITLHALYCIKSRGKCPLHVQRLGNSILIIIIIIIKIIS